MTASDSEAWVPEADRAEQLTPAAETDDPSEYPTALSVQEADEADVLEQATSVPTDEDDFPPTDY